MVETNNFGLNNEQTESQNTSTTSLLTRHKNRQREIEQASKLNNNIDVNVA